MTLKDPLGPPPLGHKKKQRLLHNNVVCLHHQTNISKYLSIYLTCKSIFHDFCGLKLKHSQETQQNLYNFPM